jgi:hypothetical protein
MSALIGFFFLTTVVFAVLFAVAYKGKLNDKTISINCTKCPDPVVCPTCGDPTVCPVCPDPVVCPPPITCPPPVVASDSSSDFTILYAGSSVVGSGGGGIKSVNVTFASPLATVPNVIANIYSTGTYLDTFAHTISNVTTTGFTINVYRADAWGGGWGQSLQAYWLVYNSNPSVNANYNVASQSNVSTVYTIPFGKTYSVVPNVVADITAASGVFASSIQSVTASGFTIAVNRMDAATAVPIQISWFANINVFPNITGNIVASIPANTGTVQTQTLLSGPQYSAFFLGGIVGSAGQTFVSSFDQIPDVVGSVYSQPRVNVYRADIKGSGWSSPVQFMGIYII